MHFDLLLQLNVLHRLQPRHRFEDHGRLGHVVRCLLKFNRKLVTRREGSLPCGFYNGHGMESEVKSSLEKTKRGRSQWARRRSIKCQIVDTSLLDRDASQFNAPKQRIALGEQINFILSFINQANSIGARIEIAEGPYNLRSQLPCLQSTTGTKTTKGSGSQISPRPKVERIHVTKVPKSL